MSFVLFKDSFGRYDLGSLSGASFDNFVSRYTFAGGGLTIVSDGRSGQGIEVGQGSFGKTLPHSAEWVVGFAVRSNTIGTNTFMYRLSNNDANLFEVFLDADGTVSLRSGNTTFAVSDRALLQDRWYYIEAHVTVGGATPVTVDAELRINGHVEASGSANTSFNDSQLLSGDATGNLHSFGGPSGVGNSRTFDDIYIKNEAGYEDDIRNEPVYADGDGGILDWTPNSGSTHFDRVNTHPADLTKWLETATPGDIDLWTFTLPSFSGSIVAINISVLARKDDEGTKSFKIVVGTTGTDAESDEFFVSDVSPEYYEFSLKEDPATSMPFVPGQTLVVGVKLIS